MAFQPDQVANLRYELLTVNDKYLRLLAQFVSFSNSHAASYEYAFHGFMRRLGTLTRCVQNVYSLYMPDRTDIPPRETCVDLAINLQAFIFNIFGCLDNLAWIWVKEKQLMGANGRPLPPSAVGLRKETVRGSFSAEFRNCLVRFDDWIAHVENFRHSAAHRIPLYIPPFCVTPDAEQLYNAFEAQKATAMRARDFDKYHRLDLEQQQETLGRFVPAMTHSHVEGSRPVYFHPQVLADWNTIVEIAETFLRQFTD